MPKGQVATIDGYATHLPVLAFAIGLAQRERLHTLRALELGCGNYSTRLLHAAGYELHVVTTDHEWSAQFQDLTNAHWHWLYTWTPDFKIPTYPEVDSHGFDICLLDNEQLVSERILHLPRLLNVSRLVIMHDWREGLEVPECLSHIIYKVHRPWTLIASRFLNLGMMQEGLL